MQKPPDILDRERDWAYLLKLWQSPKPALAFVLGRRRVGKSYVLARLAKEVGGIYYQATRRIESEQLSRLSLQVGRQFNDPALKSGVTLPDWEALFGYLVDRADGKPFLLVLDEFPFLVDSAPALPSIIQALWDHEWQDTSIKLVLSGSFVTAMEQLETSDQPLYGRRTGLLKMEPFSYRHAAEFVPRYAGRDRLKTYAFFGGLPGHLALLDPGRSLKANVCDQMLSPGSRLVDEAQHLLDVFIADAQVYYSVIEAIATGSHTWQKLTNRVNRSGAALSRPLHWLMNMQIVERVVPVTEARPDRSRRSLYRLTDPYLAFWHRFVSPMLSAGQIGLAPPEDLWKRYIEPRVDDYMGPWFEEICRDFVRENAVLPFEPVRVGEWWDSTSTHQIDIVAVGADGEVLFGECKWGRATRSDFADLQMRADVALGEIKGVRQVHFALFTGRGISAELEGDVEAGKLLHITADELF